MAHTSYALALTTYPPLPETYQRLPSAGWRVPLRSVGCGSPVAGFMVLPEVSRKPWTFVCDREVQLWPVRPSRQNASILAE